MSNVHRRTLKGQGALVDAPDLDSTGVVLRTSYDVIVVGATEQGCMAAVAAARQGASVLLVSDSDRVGGFSGHGITVTDFLNGYTPAMIGGLTREFFGRIASRDARGSAASFERWHRQGGGAKPSWYSREFREMLAGVPVLYNATLDSATRTGTTITSVVLSGRTFTATVWVDATSTGDLVQKAGLTYVIGREASSTYTETGAGVTALGSLGIDPYVTAGNAGSGLLFGVDPGTAGSVGSADSHVMTFGWRVFLTSVSGEKGSFPAPNMAVYDRTKYELLCRLWNSNPTFYNDSTNAVVRTFQVYPFQQFGGSSVQGGSPYQYIDLNSLGYISSNYPNAAECLEYVTATPARRAVIVENARQWLLGLFYFIANDSDSRIPANLKSGLALYGPSTKELQASAGMPTQFYVREGARVVGDFVLTLPNCVVNSGYTDIIGWGAYQFDGHPCRVVNNAGTAAQEGTVSTAATGQTMGFPIPYRVLLPKVAEATNLLCPGQPSVSRMAYTAVRAIPVIMQLGEAAGIAAAAAARNGSTVQAVSAERVMTIQDLQRVADGHAIISADGFWTGGTRTEAGAGTAFATQSGTGKRWGWLAVGENSLNSVGSAKSVAASTARTVTYAPNLFRSGRYRVFLYYPAVASGDISLATNLPVTINHADGATTRTVNQAYPGGDSGGWDDLGEYHFVKGTPSANTVVLDATTANGVVVDTAVKFVLVP